MRLVAEKIKLGYGVSERAIFPLPSIARSFTPELIAPAGNCGGRNEELLILRRWWLRFRIFLLQRARAFAPDFALFGFRSTHRGWWCHSEIGVNPLPPLGLINVCLADRRRASDLVRIRIQRENWLVGSCAVLRRRCPQQRPRHRHQITDRSRGDPGIGVQRQQGEIDPSRVRIYNKILNQSVAISGGIGHWRSKDSSTRHHRLVHAPGGGQAFGAPASAGLIRLRVRLRARGC